MSKIRAGKNILDSAFVTKKAKNDKEIERAVKKNFRKIDLEDEDNLQEIHKNIIDILEIKDKKDSKYFSFENFKQLIEKIAEEKKKKHNATKDEKENNEVIEDKKDEKDIY